MIGEPAIEQVFESAVAMAVRAPSVHNTQPWLWVLSEGVIQLHADPSRALPVTDPMSRSLLISCGAALHHMRLALAVHGRQADVTYLPDPRDPDHLADITITPATASAEEIDLAAAIMHRQSDRRRYSPRPVPPRMMRQVAAAAPPFGAAARQVPQTLRGPLAATSHEAAARHARDPRYMREVASWSGRKGTADGVPAANTPPPRTDDDILMRQFADPRLTDLEFDADDSSGEWLVLCTPADDRSAQLRAGEAASAVLLTASSLGLASCLQTEPLGLPDLATTIRDEVLQECAFPQVTVRLGWVPVRAAPPALHTPPPRQRGHRIPPLRHPYERVS